MTEGARNRYTSVLAETMSLRDQLKGINDAEDAAAARKGPTRDPASSVGTHHFSMLQALDTAVANMRRGKGRAVDLSVRSDRPPSTEPEY